MIIYLICAFLNLIFSIVCMKGITKYDIRKKLNHTDFILTMILVLTGPIGTLGILVAIIITFLNKE